MCCDDICCSDEDTDVKALVSTWLSHRPETDQQMLAGWIDDHFYKAMDWVMKQVTNILHCWWYRHHGDQTNVGG